MLVIPSSAARSFISATKPSSLPATASASAVQASLADAITDAFSKSFTVMVPPGSSHICDPPIEAACSLAVTTVSRDRSPRSIASITSSSDIILVIDAGGSFSSGLFS